MVNENVIATLEQSLRQMQQSRSQKFSRLREIEGEADNLRQEIQAIDSSVEQIKKTIHSLLFAVRTSKGHSQRVSRELDLPDLDLPDDLDDYLMNPEPQPRNIPNYNSRSVVSMHRGNQSNSDNSPIHHAEVQIKNIRFRDRTITQSCSILIQEAGRPLHVNDIYNRLLEGGFMFTGNNPTISIAVSLNRNRRFRKVAPGTFDLIIRDASQAAS